MEVRSSKHLLMHQVSHDNVWDAPHQDMAYEMHDAEASASPFMGCAALQVMCMTFRGCDAKAERHHDIDRACNT